MKHIAILGDPSSIWIKTYVNEVFENDSDSIVIFTDKPVNEETQNFYSNKIKIISCSNKKIVKKLKLDKILYLLKTLYAFSKEEKFDYLHVHYVNNRKLIAVNAVKRYVKKIIITFWGSDLLRKDRNELNKMSKYLENANKITVGSNEMKKFFINNFPEKISNKISVVRFGVNGLSAIYNMQTSQSDIKVNWGIPNEKYVFTIGYNGSEQQNHIRVLNELKNIPENLRNNIYLILPMTYGLNEDYYKKIKTLIEDIGCEYLLLLDYMDTDEIAKLCNITDVFVHAQKTDAFSASVQEYLCAGKLLINPSWITYDELINNHVFYWEFKTYDELKTKIEHFISSGLTDDEEKFLNNNKQIMFMLSSWDSLRHKWLELYK